MFLPQICSNIFFPQGEQVADRVVAAFPKSSRPEVLKLDLTSLSSVRVCAAELKTKIERIDYLINNAGRQNRFPIYFRRKKKIFMTFFGRQIRDV